MAPPLAQRPFPLHIEHTYFWRHGHTDIELKYGELPAPFISLQGTTVLNTSVISKIMQKFIV